MDFVGNLTVSPAVKKRFDRINCYWFRWFFLGRDTV